MVSNQELEERVAQGPLAFKEIDPKHGWGEDYLYEQVDKMNDIQKYRKRLQEDASDTGAGEDICKVAFGKYGPDIYYNILNPQKTRRLAKDIDEKSRDKMAEFTMNHLDDVLELFDGNELLALVMKIPMYKIDSEERAVSAIMNLKGLSKIAQENDIGEIRKVVAEAAKHPAIPAWYKSFLRFVINDDKFVAFMYKGELQKAQYFVQKELIHNGKPDEDKIKKMIKDSIAEAEYEWKEEIDPSDHGDAWKINIRPLSDMAKHAYAKLRKKHYEDDEDEEDRLERLERRKSKGMPF